jgi:hypothetical protein
VEGHNSNAIKVESQSTFYQHLMPGNNRTTAIYKATVVKIYNATVVKIYNATVVKIYNATNSLKKYLA